MATLEEFLKTGILGPITIGISPSDVALILGEPTEQSRKTNPLLLKYGSLELTFWRKGHNISQLLEIAVQLEGGYKLLPEHVRPLDFELDNKPSLRDVHAFLERINYPPTQTVTTASERRVTLNSGMQMLFVADALCYLNFKRRQIPERAIVSVPNVQEPTELQIKSLFNEAFRATTADFMSAGLLLAWGGLEAVLRRMAHASDLGEKVGVQPLVIARELLAVQKLSFEEFTFVDRVRQIRTAAAHGLVTPPIEKETVLDTIELAERLLRKLNNKHQ